MSSTSAKVWIPDIWDKVASFRKKTNNPEIQNKQKQTNPCKTKCSVTFEFQINDEKTFAINISHETFEMYLY